MNRPIILAAAFALALSACAGPASQTTPNVSTSALSQARLRNAIPLINTYKILYSFGATSSDGQGPYGGLLDVDGVLYGTTSGGGTATYGTTFSLTTSGTETVLHNFIGTDGSLPESNMINVGGVYYGTTYQGGAHGAGTVYSMTPSGTLTVLHSFSNSPDGASPMAGLVAVKGVLYGTTSAGGANGVGTVYKITKAGKETVLHSFSELSTDGYTPRGGLVNFNGVLYGCTTTGGAYGGGTIYAITTGGTETNLWNFGDGDGGAGPDNTLLDLNGVLYGTTADGGSNDEGTVFSFTPTPGGVTTLHDFGAPGDGTTPESGLVAINGVLYGTTLYGTNSATAGGTIYDISIAGMENVLWGFGSSSGGEYPNTTPIAHNGTLYGTTEVGGAHGDGVVYSFKP